MPWKDSVLYRNREAKFYTDGSAIPTVYVFKLNGAWRIGHPGKPRPGEYNTLIEAQAVCALEGLL